MQKGGGAAMAGAAPATPLHLTVHVTPPAIDPKDEHPTTPIIAEAEKQASATSAGCSAADIRASLKELRRQGIIAKTTIVYNPNHPIKSLVRFSGTALEMVVTKPDFYLIVVLHVVLCVLYYEVAGNSKTTDNRGGDGTGGWPWLANSGVAVAGALIVFFLVFHTNSAYNRFFAQYDAVRLGESRIGQVGTKMRAIFRDDAFFGARETRVEVCKKLAAAQYAGFASMPQYKAVGVADWAWRRTVETGLLTEAEMTELKGSGLNPVREIVCWAWGRIYEHVRLGNIDTHVYVDLQKHFLEIQSSFTKLNNFTAMPVPFAFYHLLNLMLIVYLFILAYTYTYLAYYYSIVGMVLTASSLLGLRELSNALADPFGNDATDIPVLDYVINTHCYILKTMNEPPMFLKDKKL